MRILTNNEKKRVAGGDFKITDAQPPGSPFDMVFFVSGGSQVSFGGYTHYAFHVTDLNGNKVFKGNDGGFVGANNSFCSVFPVPIGEKGSVYMYLKSWNNDY